MTAIQVDPRLPTPPSRQIVEGGAGPHRAPATYEAGRPTPERAGKLAAEVLVNPNTVGKAYRDLEALGVVAGTLVARVSSSRPGGPRHRKARPAPGGHDSWTACAPPLDARAAAPVTTPNDSPPASSVGSTPRTGAASKATEARTEAADERTANATIDDPVTYGCVSGARRVLRRRGPWTCTAWQRPPCCSAPNGDGQDHTAPSVCLGVLRTHRRRCADPYRRRTTPSGNRCTARAPAGGLRARSSPTPVGWMTAARLASASLRAALRDLERRSARS